MGVENLAFTLIVFCGFILCIFLFFCWRGLEIHCHGGVLANFALLPLNYNDFIGVPILIGPAWSLACEVHFYLLVPLLASCPTKMLRVVLLSSLSLFTLSPFLPHSTFLGCASLPGILFTFTTGMLINRKDFAFIKIVYAVMALLLAAFALTKIFHAGLPTGIHINVAIGYLIAVVAISFLDRFSPKIKWDVFLGLFSYPLFLCHGIVARFVGAHFSVSNPLGLLSSSIIFAAVLILIVEIPFDRIRYKVRKEISAEAK
jgi:peptidoglycan/LPS O-acetylase OafA/YrhL